MSNSHVLPFLSVQGRGQEGLQQPLAVSAGIAPLSGLLLARVPQRSQHDEKAGRDRGLPLNDRQTGQLKLLTRHTQTTSENDLCN